jgi:UDP-N-acetylmuramoyl-tripeptide--D-alanyl-D-alanine ligase
MNYSDPYEILREKVSLLDHLTGDRIAILNRAILDVDDSRERLVRAKPVANLITVGADRDSDVHLLELDAAAGAVRGVMSVFGTAHRFELPLAGKHFAENAMFAVATAHALGHDAASAVDALLTFVATDGRMTRWRIETGTAILELVDDSYNAAPKSVEGLLGFLAERRNLGRKVLVLGDMRELGVAEEALHDALAPRVDQAGIDLLITVGALAARIADTVSPKLETVRFETADQAAGIVPSLLQHGDLVAVKASRAVGLDKLVAEIKSSANSASLAPPGWQIEDESE